MRRRDLLRAIGASCLSLPALRKDRSLACQPPSEFSEIPVSKKKKKTIVAFTIETVHPPLPPMRLNRGKLTKIPFEPIDNLKIRIDIKIDFSDESRLVFENLDANDVKLYEEMFHVRGMRNYYSVLDYHLDSEKLLLFTNKGQLLFSARLQ